MSLTKEEFDKRLDSMIGKYMVACINNKDSMIAAAVTESEGNVKRLMKPQKDATDTLKLSLRQLVLDATGDPAEDCDFCGSLDSIREIVKGE